ncbi:MULTISPECIES: MFS transporter [unclassified Bartonella]|uniref:MFS transporter n=1 Tax=unclassified Bartonella TaxID=2645622 RepID=UPI00235E6183|nr:MULTISPECIES: MFS transporter [unclassified Bartonella]
MVVPFLAIYLSKLNSLSGYHHWYCFLVSKSRLSFRRHIFRLCAYQKKHAFGFSYKNSRLSYCCFTYNFYLLLFCCVFIGLGSSIYLPAAKSFLVKNVSTAEKVGILSTRLIFSNIGTAIGPLLGMLIFKVHPPLLFSLVGFIFCLLFLLNCTLKNNPDTNTRNKIHFFDFRKLLTIHSWKTLRFMALFS